MASNLSGWDYDVFLSFNGQDTSRNFADHLLTALKEKGVVSYNRANEAGGGGDIVEVIRGSRFAVVVFSVNYASSLTCLDELSAIYETQTSVGQQPTILPVFYDVEPSAVRKQSHSFQTAFDEYEVVFEGDLIRVRKWREALSKVACMSGWDLRNKSESQCIQEIVKLILSKLNESFANVADELVGIDARVDELMRCLKLESREVRAAAICGVTGIGKTVIARTVFDRIFGGFEGACFLSDVRQASRKNGLENLQVRIISEIFKEDLQQKYGLNRMTALLENRLRRKKVLLILDGVDELEQLEMLAGSRDWFGPGSRIVVTATDEDLFRNYEVDEIYRPCKLNEDEGIRLLSLKAFRQVSPPEEYLELSKQIVLNAKGIPAAVDVVGNFLYGRRLTEWESAVQRLGENPKRYRSATQHDKI